MSRPRGFTLIELMVALLVSSLLVGMILAIFSRMSIAYRGQQQIAGVQQVLAAARATIELDAKQAGLEISQGFKLVSDAPPAAPGTVHSPVSIVNSTTGPDQIAFFYADTTTQAVVTVSAWPASITVDSTVGFTVGDLVVLVALDVSGANNPIPVVGVNDPTIAKYDACVLQIATTTGSSPGTLTFATAAPWGNPGQTHCTPPVPRTMLYKFVARAYKIDVSPARVGLGALQQSPTGGLIGTAADNWTDLAFGFTDIQTAIQIYDNDGADLDGDGDADREWYSGPGQDALTQPGVPPTVPPRKDLLQMSISLVARTDRDVAVPRPPLPAWTRANNPLGDHPAVAVPSATDLALQGTRIYRYITFHVDFRNLGIGR
jgi:prepilin-type N-terminal cleavage/methylation domain-containing protein